MNPSNNKQIEYAIKALIIKDNHFLALHKRNIQSLKYELPGGRMSFGETAEETVIREVLEETTLNITPVSLVDTWNYVAETKQVTGVIYLCKLAPSNKTACTAQTPPATITLSEEHDQYAWLTPTPESFEKMNRLFAPQMQNWDWTGLIKKVQQC